MTLRLRERGRGKCPGCDEPKKLEEVEDIILKDMLTEEGQLQKEELQYVKAVI